MPLVLNKYGKAGWRLVAVNKMECFIFNRPLERRRLEYKVLTPADLDKRAIALLKQEGAADVVSDEDNQPLLQISDPYKAKIQNILPKALLALSREGWSLAAINGPQLHFFVRELG